jgi:hypothetical protein
VSVFNELSQHSGLAKCSCKKEWRRRCLNLFENRCFTLASKSFLLAGDQQWASKSHARGLMQGITSAGGKDHYLDAAVSYKHMVSGMLVEAASAMYKSGNFVLAGQMFVKVGDHLRAATCVVAAGAISEKAKYSIDGGYVPKARALLTKHRRFSECAQLLQQHDGGATAEIKDSDVNRGRTALLKSVGQNVPVQPNQSLDSACQSDANQASMVVN